MKNQKMSVFVVFLMTLAACSAVPENTQTIECRGAQYPVTYMSEMQQYEVERFAMRNEFRPGCVSSKLKQIKLQTCQTASTLNYEQWMTLYTSCKVNNG